MFERWKRRLFGAATSTLYHGGLGNGESTSLLKCENLRVNLRDYIDHCHMEWVSLGHWGNLPARSPKPSF